MLGKIEAGKEDNRRWDRRMEPTTPRILDWKLWDCAKDTEACRVAVHRVAKRGTLVTTQLTWNEWIHACRGIPRAHHSHPNTLLETCLPTYPLPFRGLPTPDPCLRTIPPQTAINPFFNFVLQWGPLRFQCFSLDTLLAFRVLAPKDAGRGAHMLFSLQGRWSSPKASSFQKA